MAYEEICRAIKGVHSNEYCYHRGPQAFDSSGVHAECLPCYINSHHEYSSDRRRSNYSRLYHKSNNSVVKMCEEVSDAKVLREMFTN